jgi:lysozyme family protein
MFSGISTKSVQVFNLKILNLSIILKALIMADFDIALQNTLKNEGGYVFDKSDPGGETYKGIARKMNGGWVGWKTIDLFKKQANFPANLEINIPLQNAVNAFYKLNYWDVIKGSNLNNQVVANSIFDFAVNTGVSISVSLAQNIVGASNDGIIGPAIIVSINKFNPDHFLASFTVAKISRYVAIIKNRPSSQKYFFGWVCRALDENV